MIRKGSPAKAVNRALVSPTAVHPAGSQPMPRITTTSRSAASPESVAVKLPADGATNSCTHSGPVSPDAPQPVQSSVTFVQPAEESPAKATPHASVVTGVQGVRPKQPPGGASSTS